MARGDVIKVLVKMNRDCAQVECGLSLVQSGSSYIAGAACHLAGPRPSFACTHHRAALATQVHSPPCHTRNPAALGSQLPSPPVRCAWICVQPIISTHENASHRKPKAHQSMRRHFFAQSSMSCMQQSRRRSSTHFEASLRRRFTHFEASLRRRQPLKRRISAHKFA